MKKPASKLVVHRQTLRVLARVELTRIDGGGDGTFFQSGIKNCVEVVSPPAAPSATGG